MDTIIYVGDVPDFMFGGLTRRASTEYIQEARTMRAEQLPGERGSDTLQRLASEGDAEAAALLAYWRQAVGT